MTPIPGQNCYNCKFWDVENDSQRTIDQAKTFGCCIVHPWLERVVSISHIDQLPENAGVWPTTKAIQWCGEWKHF